MFSVFVFLCVSVTVYTFIQLYFVEKVSFCVLVLLYIPLYSFILSRKCYLLSTWNGAVLCLVGYCFALSLLSLSSLPLV